MPARHPLRDGAGRPMILRVWLGFAAIGAGLIHLALAIGSPPLVAAVVIVIGLAEFGWGVLAVAAERPPIATAARIGAIVPVLLWALVLVVAGPAQLGPFTSAIRLLPMLIASALDLVLVIGLTVAIRRPRPAAAGGAALRLVLILLGAVVVAALTLPALAATEAGEQVRTGGFTGHQH